MLVGLSARGFHVLITSRHTFNSDRPLHPFLGNSSPSSVVPYSEMPIKASTADIDTYFNHQFQPHGLERAATDALVARILAKSNGL
jgi:hypothetical protein